VSAQSAAAHTQRLDTLCDRCPAPAQFNVATVKGELLFCTHHVMENKNALESYVVKALRGRKVPA